MSNCIPYRLLGRKDEDSDICLEKRLEVLMITSPNRDDLVFPKGGWEDDESITDAASREALEEAGVKGILHKEEVGVWEFRSKSKQCSSSVGGGCRGHMFALKVTEELEAWPEMEVHERKWLSMNEAIDLCRYEWMREALRDFLKFIEMRNGMDSTSSSKDLWFQLISHTT
ncbi:Peroxisomal NADH pyrophosphatase nudt12, variant 2 [Dionaea muscipula]